MQQLVKLIGTLLMCLLLLPTSGLASDQPPAVMAKAAIVMEASTGKVLYGKNAEERRYPASTTKIMTLITALEYGKLDDVVTASANAVNTEGSSLSLAQGEQLNMQDMLYGIMLISGNDATVAVAEHISGSVQRFAGLMTEKARTIGAKDTNFTNSSGLPDAKHYTTALDLAKITAYGYKSPVFSQIVATEHKVIPWLGKDHDRDLYNENKMLWQYQGANGVKTGYTEAAGRCLVSSAVRGGIQLIVVVLDSDIMWEDSTKLLDYGFSQLEPVAVISQGDILKTVKINEGKAGEVRLVSASAITLPISDDERDKFSTIVDAPNKLNAPVLSGQKVGTVRVIYNDKEVASSDLIADQSVDRNSFFSLLWGAVRGFLTFVIRNFA